MVWNIRNWIKCYYKLLYVCYYSMWIECYNVCDNCYYNWWKIFIFGEVVFIWKVIMERYKSDYISLINVFILWSLVIYLCKI